MRAFRVAVVLGLSLIGLAAPLHAQWPIKTREHVDLWLTAFAELNGDTAAKVPTYRRDYLETIAFAENQHGLLTSLDSVHDRLQAHWDVTPTLAGARSLALDAGTWEEMNSAIDLYLEPAPKDQGGGGITFGGPKRPKPDPKAPKPDVYNRLPDYFSTPNDRQWLGELAHGLDGMRSQFYHSWWVAEQRRRLPVLVATDSVWRRVYQPKLQGFLTATHQGTGEIILSLPVNGGGVALQLPNGPKSIAVPFPDSADAAVEVVYVFAHEAAKTVAADAITAGTTADERRNGIAAQYAEALAVRGGALLLQRTAPELASGYARYYSRGGDPAALASQFPLPDKIRDALAHQIDLAIK